MVANEWEALMNDMGFTVNPTHWDVTASTLTVRGSDQRFGKSMRWDYPLTRKDWMTGHDRCIGILVHGISHKEHVRRNWYRRHGLPYVPKNITVPLVLKFGLWEQAEARHKEEKAQLTTRESTSTIE